MPTIEELTQKVTELGSAMETAVAGLKKSFDENAPNKALETELANMKSEMETLNKQVTDEIDARRKAEAEAQRLQQFGGSTGIKSIAQQTFDSEAYKQLVKAAETRSSIAFELALKEGFSPHMKAAELFGPEGGYTKATLVEGTYQVPGPLANITFRPEIYGPLPRRVSVRELMPNLPTATGTVEYTVEKDWHDNPTGAAAVVIESGAAPETTMEFLDKQSSAKRIAHFIPVTRKILTDVPRLQGYLNYRLPLMLRWKEDAELMYGAGGSDAITGFKLTSGVQTYSWSDGVPTDTMADAVAKAIAKVTVTNMIATGIVLNPLDYTEIITTKANSSGLYLYPPSDNGKLWGLPVVQTVAMNQGEFLVGAFDMAAELHVREDSMIRVSDQHADFFIKDKIAMMAEERIELALTRPRAFVWGVFDNAPAS